jgi:hypothetical protein
MRVLHKLPMVCTGTVTEARRTNLKRLLSSICDVVQRRAFAGGKG